MTLPLGLLERLPIRTGRLLLTRLDASHLPDLAAMLADPAVMRHFPRVMSLPETDLWLRRTVERYAQHGTGLLAVLRADGSDGPALLGDCGLQVRSFGGRAHLELGYHLARHGWGYGYATEAARACVRLGFAGSDVSGIVALIRPENRPSRAVARRVGLQPGGAVLHAGLVHDVWHIHREALTALDLQ